MSGPKYSRAVLRDAQALRRLMEQLQREIEAQKCKELTTAINVQVKKNCAFLKSIQDYSALIDRVNATGGTPECSRLEDLQKKIQAMEPTPHKNGNSNQLSGELSLLEKQYRKMQSLKRQIADIVAQLQTLVTQRQQNEREKLFIQAEHHQVIEQVKIEDQRVRVAMDQAYDELSSLADGEACAERLTAIVKENTGGTQEQLTIVEKFVESARMEDDYHQNHSVDLTTRTEYCALCQISGKLADESLDAASMEEAALQMKACMAEERKQAYIAATVQEVLGGMGYRLLEKPQILTAVNTSKTYFGLSQDSVLNVSSSATGALMFEVQGLRHGDAITQEQKARVVQDMERFCPDYQRVKDALRARGIELEDERLFPPLEQYVRFTDQRFVEQSQSSDTAQRKERYLEDE